MNSEQLGPHAQCDRCGFRGYVLVMLRDLVLIFCKHHFEQHELALLLDGWDVIVDSRDELLARVTTD